MIKRKRYSQDKEQIREGRSKKAKVQKKEDEKVSHVLHMLKDAGTNQRQEVEDDAHHMEHLTRLKRRERRRLKKEQQATLKSVVERESEGKRQKNPQVLQVRPEQSTKRERRKKKHGRNDNEQQAEKSPWKILDPIGGRMLDLEPVFSSDEKHLLLAYDKAIVVYSTATSLPIRHLRINKADRITAFAFSSSSESQIYLSTLSGTIERWDWSHGSRIGSWKLSSLIYSLKTVYPATSEADTNDLVFTVDTKGTGSWLMSAHRLADRANNMKPDVKTLLSHSKPISFMKVLENGRYIIATSESQLIIGNCDSPDPPNLQDLSYTWRIVECPEWITSFDARISYDELPKEQSKKGTKENASLVIAVGGLKGSIHIYEDLLGKLICKEHPNSKERPVDIMSRRLHWHRNAVLAIKWSLDGNYLISGGGETVLVLWQLETGHRQDLPHLGAPIESIVVAPSGASYALRLADNSAMVVSTSELRPTFSVAGILITPRSRDSAIKLPFIPTVDQPRELTNNAWRPYYPVCIPPARPNCLLLAVPSSSPSNQNTKTSRNASYLQTFDLGANHQLYRQALTRTKVTSLNMGPESNTIEEPNVTHMQTTNDGQWLATVDQWMPPKRDLTSLAFDQERMGQEQNFRQEVYLRFWSWKDDSKIWELVSRIDNPHASRFGNSYARRSVLGLSSDPSTPGFATIGADGTVKTWKPTIRRRNGLDVRNKDGGNLFSWHCKHAVALNSAEFGIKSGSQGAKLAYSLDGSILVAGLQTPSTSPLYVIDTHSGDIKSRQTGLHNGPLLGLGIIDKYLITLSHQLCVWDLVDDELRYGIELELKDLSVEKQIAMTHIAVDIPHGLFAITLPELGQNTPISTESKSQLAIFGPTDAAPVFQTALPNSITTLIPATGKKGFIAIDTAAEIRTIVLSQSSLPLPSTKSKEEQAPSRGLSDIFGGGKAALGLSNGSSPQSGPMESNFKNITLESHVQDEDTVVVSQDQLAEVFDVGPAYALPPVLELFEQVASLYSGRIET